jgi:glucuronate isomerase
LQYSLEWAFFARTQWGQPDIPVYELERAWNQAEPSAPIAVTFDRASAPPLERTIRTVDDVDEAVAHYCELIPYDRVMATAQHLSTDIDYAEPDTSAMQAALRNRAAARSPERDVYASYILRRFLAELTKRGEDIVFQFSLGAEPLPYESASRLSQHTIKQLAELVARYPEVRFMCFLASRHANQSLCTLARELPNLSLAGYWWHNFFPGAIRQVMEERLDMLPLNKQIGFFSDAYCAEWSYAKAVMVRKLLADVLAGKIALGQYTEADALEIAQAILHDAPQKLLGMGDARSGGATGFQPVIDGENDSENVDHSLEGHGTSGRDDTSKPTG